MICFLSSRLLTSKQKRPAKKQVCIIYFNALKGQFCNRDSIPIVTMLPYKFKDSKPLNVQKKRWNFGTFLCIIHQRNKSPCAALCGAFVGKGKPLGGNKTTSDRGNTAAVRAAAPFGALVLDCGFWVTVRSGTPIQIRRLPRIPHRKGHRHRFPFP